MGIYFTQYTAHRQETELRSELIMDQLNQLTSFPPLENGDATKSKKAKSDFSSSRPPSPPESGTTTPRLTLAPCPTRLRPLYPPPNYGCVDRNKIYRSSYPQDRNVDFVRSLGVRTVLTLVDTEPSRGFQYWIENDRLPWAKLEIKPNKDKSGRIDTKMDSICEAILFLLDSSNHPVYVHCNQGKHRTGCVVACLRKVQGWSMKDIMEEYEDYAGGKSRAGDRALIKAFNPETVYEYAQTKGLLNSLYDADTARNRIPRSDSTITDIRSLRAALEAGLLGDLDSTSDMGSTSSRSSSRTVTPPGTRTPVVLQNGRIEAEQTTTTEYVDGTDTRIVSEEVNESEDTMMLDGPDESNGLARV